MPHVDGYCLGNPAELTRAERDALKRLSEVKVMSRLRGGFGILGKVLVRFDKAWALEKRGLVTRTPSDLKISAKGLETLEIAAQRSKRSAS